MHEEKQQQQQQQQEIVSAEVHTLMQQLMRAVAAQAWHRP
jgi:hypothetical protein